ncbi:hypothetical protein H2201_005860 [Coniosporium apollinis]|uniref:HPP transmembrane region domain-containing protein n=2 Tax=Coniosporium TaxID=2810619 RepID=A0ABQ9NTX2_9PEZI|nr:hypothetical protein H2199_004439 [Cladosporium sp. JES 115]KAJ9662982.1 hypothetical protein H2201_005860 [Coniosporium apollinis]
MGFPAAKDMSFDIDKYINRFVPPSQLHRLPKPISRFLGYRESAVVDVGSVLVWFWAFVGAFIGIIVVAQVYMVDAIQKYSPPVLFASFGATAILDYQTIKSPLAQPRNAIVGHGLSAVVGVAITKLFMLSENFQDIRWLAGALSCGLSSSIMGATNTIHPPGGATALIAAIDPVASAMGWMFVPIVLLGAVLMLFVALVVNNIQRQFPMFWWTPLKVGRQIDHEAKQAEDVEKQAEDADVQKLERTFSKVYGFNPEQCVIITADDILLPENFSLGPEEKGIAQIFRSRLRNHLVRRNLAAPSVDSDSTWGAD